MTPTSGHGSTGSHETTRPSETRPRLTVRGHRLVDGAYRVGADDELRMKLVVTCEEVDPERLSIRLRREGYDLRLMFWGDGSGVPTSERSLVIAGMDHYGLLHIRIFDASGRKVTDTDEAQLTDTRARAISTLKQELPDLSSRSELTAAEKAKLVGDVMSIIGQARQEEDGNWRLCRPLAARTAMLSGERSLLFTVELPRATPIDLSRPLLKEIEEATDEGLLSPDDAADLRAHRNTLSAHLAETYTTAVPGRYKVQALYDAEPEPLESDEIALDIIPSEHAPAGSHDDLPGPGSPAGRDWINPINTYVNNISDILRWASRGGGGGRTP